MISTLSKQGGRRYPQMGSTGLAMHGRLLSVGETVSPVVFDYHDGGEERKRRDQRRNEEKRLARERLREQIRLAMFGPQAEEVRAELSPYSEPSEAKPFWQTVDVEAVAQRIGKLVILRDAIRKSEYEMMLEAEDEEIILLV